jgi:alcohol dehydrogenase
MQPFDFHLRTRLIFGAGTIERLGDVARELGFRRALLVADHGLVASGHVAEALTPLDGAGTFRSVRPIDTLMIGGMQRLFKIVLLVGGGSSPDCEGISFLLATAGGYGLPGLWASHRCYR